MSQPQTQADQARGPNITRRRFAQSIGATGAAAVGLSGRSPFVDDAEALAPLAYAGVAGVAYVAGHGLLADDDVSEIEEAEANELHDRIYADALEIEPDIIDQIESTENNLELLRERVRTDAAFTIAEEAEMGSSEEDTKEAAEEQIAETAAGFQQRIAQRYERDALAMARRWQLAYNEEELETAGEAFETLDNDGNIVDGESDQEYEFAEHDEDYSPLELVDGSEVNIPEETFGRNAISIDPETNFDEDDVRKIAALERDGGGQALLLDCQEYQNLFEEFEELVDEEQNNVQNLVDALYQPIVDGEVDAHDIASGQAIIEAGEDLDHYGQAAGAYRSINMPEAEAPAVIRTDGAELEGILFWTLPDEDGLPVEETITPSGKLGELHMAAEVVEVSEDLGDDLDAETGDVTITVEDENGDVIEDAEITIGDETETTDADGIAEFDEIPHGPNHVEIEHDDETTEKTIEVDEDTTSFEIVADGEDTTDEDDVSSFEEDTVVTVNLQEAFEIVGIDGGGDTLHFADRDLIDPDEQEHEELIEELQDAYDREQETREERQEIIIDDGLFGGSLFGDDGVPGGSVGLLAGIAAIIYALGASND